MALTLALSTAGAAKEQPPEPLLPCPQAASQAMCNPSKRDQKQAKAAFERGLKLEQKFPEEAYAEFQHAAELVPRDVNYVTARELTRQHVVSSHIERGNAALEAGKQVEAIADFRTALKLDPGNQFAEERLRDALGDSAPKTAAPPKIVDQSPEIHVFPSQNRASFHFRGDSRELLNMAARAYGISALVEDSVQSRRVSFDIDDVDFYKAMIAANAVTKSFWAPLDSKQIILAGDTPENRRLYERMAMRKFYIPGASASPTALNEVANLLRNLFEVRFLTPDLSASTIVVRAPQTTLDAATQLLEHLDSSRPQVMIDVHVYQVSHTLMRNLGVHIPYTFNLFNIPAGALAALGGQNIQDLINQLISSGGINQANNQALSALLAQLQGQQGSNSIFKQPLATFGGGKTLTGVSLDQLSAQLSLNESWIRTLDHASLRAAQGTDATFRMGSRFPILNATFAPIFNTSAISNVIQNGSFTPAFPSFNYEDLGLTIKAKPAISMANQVALQLEMNLRALVGQSFNGVPVIGNREYKGTITLIDGEPAVVAGQISHSETLALSGIPGLGQVPGLNKVATSNSKQIDDDELLIVLTPHITNRSLGQNSEVYLTR
ncbi:MAG TPA: tetratricopeptide repeat protein [Terriglobales bacterium]